MMDGESGGVICFAKQLTIALLVVTTTYYKKRRNMALKVVSNHSTAANAVMQTAINYYEM